MIIEIGYKHKGAAYNYLSFPEVGGYSVSIQIDKHIIRNLDFEIDWAKKHNIIYSNEEEIRRECNKLIKKHTSIEPILKQVKPKTEQVKSEKNILEINKNKTYLMKDNHNNLYKIGYSKTPKFRESTLQSEKPSIKMVKVWDYDIEKKLHDLYDEFRIRGEWFKLSKIQIQYICKHF